MGGTWRLTDYATEVAYQPDSQVPTVKASESHAIDGYKWCTLASLASCPHESVFDRLVERADAAAQCLRDLAARSAAASNQTQVATVARPSAMLATGSGDPHDQDPLEHIPPPEAEHPFGNEDPDTSPHSSTNEAVAELAS